MHPALYVPISPKNLHAAEPSVQIIFLFTSSFPSDKGGQGVGAAVSASQAVSATPSCGGFQQLLPLPNLAVQTQHTQRQKALQQHHPNY